MNRLLAAVLLLLSLATVTPVYAQGGTDLTVNSTTDPAYQMYVFGTGVTSYGMSVGDVIHISGGSGWTVGNYTVTVVLSNAQFGTPPTFSQGTHDGIALDRAPAPPGSTGGVWSVIQTAPQPGTNLTVNGNTDPNYDTYVFAPGLIYSSVNIGDTIQVLSGTGWSPGNYKVVNKLLGAQFGMPPTFSQGTHDGFQLDRAPASPGTTGGVYKVVPSVVVPPLAIHPAYMGPVSMVLAGDSITDSLGDGFQTDMTTAYPNASSVLVTNLGVSGSQTSDWLPGGQNYQNLVTAINSQSATVVSVMLGTNDAQHGVTAAQYGANMQQIVTGIYGSCHSVKHIVVQQPPYMDPVASGQPASVDGLLQSYCVQLLYLQNVSEGGGVFAYFQKYPQLLNGGIHPNAQGLDALASYWDTNDDYSVEANFFGPSPSGLYANSDTLLSSYVVRLVQTHGVALLTIPPVIFGLFLLWRWSRKASH